MSIFSSLKTFLSKVKKAVSSSTKLTNKEINTLMNILDKFTKKEEIYASTILSLLGSAKVKNKYLSQFAAIMDSASLNVLDGKAAFSQPDKVTINKFFKEIGLGEKQANSFMMHFTAYRGIVLKEEVNQILQENNKSKQKSKSKVNT